MQFLIEKLALLINTTNTLTGICAHNYIHVHIHLYTCPVVTGQSISADTLLSADMVALGQGKEHGTEGSAWLEFTSKPGMSISSK